MKSNNTNRKNFSTLILMRLVVVIILLSFVFISILLIKFFGEYGFLSQETDDVRYNPENLDPFRSSTFDCTGICYCFSDPYEDFSLERRVLSNSITKGVKYAVFALSTVLAFESARNYFQDECKTHFTSEECPYKLIESEVENCEERNSDDGDPKVSQNLFEQFKLDAIGIIHTPYKKRTGMPISQSGAKGEGAVIEIFDEFVPAIDDLDGYTHIYVTFIFHRVDKTILKVNPIFDPKTERGIFSTRAPMRPNRLGLSLVEILSVKGNNIYIDGIDVIDGTPVVDIKPYLPGFECLPDINDVKTGWFGASEDQIKQKKFRSKLNCFDTDETKNKPKY